MQGIPFELILDVLDVLIVTFLLYRVFSLMQGTRAVHMFFGLIVLFVLSVIAQWMNLLAVNWLISSLRTVWVIAFVIIFQPELRRALSMLGQNRWLSRFVRMRESGVIPEVCKAVQELSVKKTGALIVFEKDMGLKNYLETGTPVDGRVSAELIETIFTRPGPLHDGAVIIQSDRLVAAGCILPLSQDERLAQALGTRHRAALGLSEETDAIVVIVSEETGGIAYAESGKLYRKVDISTLRNALYTSFGAAAKPRAAAESA
ncbi:MAG: diadenylate cyclase CdaA [Candidatus Krumholzibacteria bacterium]|nr:diadenylate cyclase CdaA [Candidatus Krumholzibacteria bacterium]MDH4337550.1 diadenylate cyclase CdaA [Candidatus Krumholzibacteria bacterium]MDH5269923.1 diadenylate cyclase CdaA [Candidatus Krumholzibacteria bacterium]